jgi:hypothetical protein
MVCVLISKVKQKLGCRKSTPEELCITVGARKVHPNTDFLKVLLGYFQRGFLWFVFGSTGV